MVIPATELKAKVVPTHLGESELGLGTGIVPMVTEVVPHDERPPEFVTIKVYTPFASVVTLLMLGFCILLVNVFGPLHAYVDISSNELKVKVVPTHFGESELGFGTSWV